MAWTAPRTWTDGELVTKAIMDPHVRDNFISTMHVQARKTADETVNNSAAYQSDDHLFFSVAANEVWVVQHILRVNTTAAADIKFQWTFPSGTAGGFFIGNNTAETLSNLSPAFSASPLDLGGIGVAGTGDRLVVFIIMHVNGATPGTLQLQWAQAAATAVNTQVLTGSAMLAARVT